MTLAPRGWKTHPPVLLLGVRENDDGDLEAEAAIVTHALRNKTLFGTWYRSGGGTRRVRVRWTANAAFGITEEVSTLEQIR